MSGIGRARSRGIISYLGWMLQSRSNDTSSSSSSSSSEYTWRKWTKPGKDQGWVLDGLLVGAMLFHFNTSLEWE
jgi:hypothetical protein